MDRITAVLERIFQERLPQALAVGSFDDLADFDSLTYIELVTSVEKEFELELAADEVQRILSYDGLVSVLAAHDISP